MIEERMGVDDFGNDIKTVSLSEKGTQWLLHNQDRLTLKNG